VRGQQSQLVVQLHFHGFTLIDTDSSRFLQQSASIRVHPRK
jgi:hypothetical protein